MRVIDKIKAKVEPVTRYIRFAKTTKKDGNKGWVRLTIMQICEDVYNHNAVKLYEQEGIFNVSHSNLLLSPTGSPDINYDHSEFDANLKEKANRLEIEAGLR